MAWDTQADGVHPDDAARQASDGALPWRDRADDCLNGGRLPSDSGSQQAIATAADLIDRLRRVRLKVGRWLPNTDVLIASGLYSDRVFAAAVRLENAVRSLDAYLAAVAVDDIESSAGANMGLQLMLCDVEDAADAFESSVLEDLGRVN